MCDVDAILSGPAPDDEGRNHCGATPVVRWQTLEQLRIRLYEDALEPLAGGLLPKLWPSIAHELH